MAERRKPNRELPPEFQVDDEVHHARDFVQYPRYVLRSGMLSALATAFYLWMVSHSPEYTITKTGILRAFPKIGDTKYRVVMEELHWFNLVKYVAQNDKSGQMKHRYLVRHPSRQEVAEWKPFVPTPRKPRAPKQ